MNENEKKVLLGETTFMSITMVAAIIAASFVAGNLATKIEANASQIQQLNAEHTLYMERIIKSNRGVEKELKELNLRLGRVEGKLDK